jgi:oligopeptidase B
VPSGHDPARYAVRRLRALSHDGTRVPVTVLHRRDTAIDGTAPLLLYGYGAYGHALPLGFSPNRLSLVDRGFVYAVAHARGGAELGQRWYEDGKMLKKRNTFLDFIAAAEHLVATGFGDPRRIVAQGGSAGGMLMGAVANMRPDLFNALVAEVPFVDVLNTMSDATLPLTPPEWFEWGNPIEDAEAFRYMLSYSPYDNVTAKAYPHILATAGLTDPRVTYWEPAKWVARLRAATTGTGRILLHTNRSAGHAGAAGRYDKLDEVARVYAFVLMVCAMDA